MNINFMFKDIFQVIFIEKYILYRLCNIFLFTFQTNSIYSGIKYLWMLFHCWIGVYIDLNIEYASLLCGILLREFFLKF